MILRDGGSNVPEVPRNAVSAGFLPPNQAIITEFHAFSLDRYA